MSYEYYQGSVFECAELKKVDMIVNTVNCKGFMGAGLALEFKLRYPSMYEEYKQKCSVGSIKVGQLDVYDQGEIKILNFPTKDDWKKPSQIDWVKLGLLYFYKHYKDYGIKSVAFPKLGTNHGGLDWLEIKDLMEKCFAEIDDIEIYVCLDNSVPIGIEGEMLKIVNSLSEEELKKLGIRCSGVENIFESVPFKRFFQVSKVNGIGTKSYERLHKYCYERTIQNNVEAKGESQQLSLFE